MGLRTLKFRGYNKKRGIWLYGNYILNRGAHFIAPKEFADGKTWEDYEVEPKTIGQFTGLTDKNDKEIYEGDIIQSESEEFVYQVVFNETRFASFGLKREQDMFLHYFGEALEAEDCKVIGNVFDNPELLKERGTK